MACRREIKKRCCIFSLTSKYPSGGGGKRCALPRLLKSFIEIILSEKKMFDKNQFFLGTIHTTILSI